MVSLPFVKMQGVGNDFVVVDGRQETTRDWSALAVTLCDRHCGVGADGLLVLDYTPKADFLMRMYNPDGTPDVCGNGLRCIARYAREYDIVPSDSMTIETLVDIRKAQIHRDTTGAFRSVTVAMGQPQFDPAVIPMIATVNPVMDYPLHLTYQTTGLDGKAHDYTLPLTVLSTGSTHAVAFVDSLPDDSTFKTVSPLVEHHPLFPERTSLMWCLRESDTRLRLRIWERGAGETWGCGTGSCAAAVAAILHNYSPPSTPITVASKGGELTIQWAPGEEISMTGPAEIVFNGIYN